MRCSILVLVIAVFCSAIARAERYTCVTDTNTQIQLIHDVYDGRQRLSEVMIDGQDYLKKSRVPWNPFDSTLIIAIEDFKPKTGPSGTLFLLLGESSEENPCTWKGQCRYQIESRFNTYEGKMACSVRTHYEGTRS